MYIWWSTNSLLYLRHTHVAVVGVVVFLWCCGGVFVVVFLIKIAHHDRPWFCTGFRHVAYVPAATHVRTADAMIFNLPQV